MGAKTHTWQSLLRPLFVVVVGIALTLVVYKYTTLLTDDEFSALVFVFFIPGVVLTCFGFARLSHAFNQLQLHAPGGKSQPRKSRFGGRAPVSHEQIKDQLFVYDVELRPGVKTKIDRRWTDLQLRALARLFQQSRDDFALFEPRGAFYEHCAAGADQPARLISAANMILQHLQLDVMVMINFSTALPENVGGRIDLVDERGCYFIELNARYRRNERAVGSILAHEITHIYDEERGLLKLGDLKDELNIDLLVQLKGLGLLPLLGARFTQVTQTPDGEERETTYLGYLPWGLLIHAFARINQAHGRSYADLGLLPAAIHSRLQAHEKALDTKYKLYLDESAPKAPREPTEAADATDEIEAWLAALAGPASDAQREALIALGQQGEAIVSRLLPNLFEGAPKQRELVVEVLGSLGSKGAGAVRFLGALLHDPEEADTLRQRAASALGYIGAEDELAMSGLQAALEEAHPGLRAAAAEALGRLGVATEEVVTLLKERLTDHEEEVAESAKRALEKLRS